MAPARSVGVLTLVTSTPQSTPVPNFCGAGGGVAMKVMSPSSSSPGAFCEDILLDGRWFGGRCRFTCRLRVLVSLNASSTKR